MSKETLLVCVALLGVAVSLLIQQDNVDRKTISRSCGYGCPLFPGLVFQGDSTSEARPNNSRKVESTPLSARRLNDASD